MKAIMISIQPKWVEKILNGEKTIEVRKKFPADYVGWVYIYCTKGKQEIGKFNTKGSYEHSLNGKVVARFWCDKVDCYDDIAYWSEENEKATCLTPNDFFDYMFHIRCCRSCRFIHITKLEIFDEPKELSEFMTPKSYQQYQRDLKQAYKDDEKTLSRLYSGCAFEYECANCVELIEMTKDCYGLKKAPQSYCFIETGE